MGKVYIQIPDDNTTQITFDDVMATLAANGGTGMTQAQGSSLFTKEAIKAPFSKKKPVRLTEAFPDRTGLWYKGVDGFCGFSLNSAKISGSALSSLLSMETMIDGALNGWEYLPPRGGAYNEPYRIRDFNGYFTKATLVAGYIAQSKSSNSPGGQLLVQITQQIDDRSLSFSDFTPFAHHYFGAIMVKEDGSYVVCRTSESPISISTEVALPTENLTVGKWRVWPFISALPIRTVDEGLLTNTFYTIPSTSVVEVQVVDDEATILILAVKEDPFTVRVTLTITNPADSAVVVSNNSMLLKFSDSELDDDLLTGEMQIQISDYTVPAQSSITVEAGVFEFVAPLLYDDCRVWVLLNGGQITQDALPREPIDVGDQE